VVVIIIVIIVAIVMMTTIMAVKEVVGIILVVAWRTTIGIIPMVVEWVSQQRARGTRISCAKDVQRSLNLHHA